MEEVYGTFNNNGNGKKWGLSRRRVTTYCTNGRIDGAIMKGNTWLIPDNAQKPENPRRSNK